MSAYLADRLQALAGDHREGRLSLDAYRKLRAPLLDSLDSCDSDDFQSSTIPHPPARAQAAQAISIIPPSSEVSGAVQERTRRRRLVRTMALAAASGLLAAAGVALWWIHEQATAKAAADPWEHPTPGAAARRPCRPGPPGEGGIACPRIKQR
jgi:hypothetical protein